MEKTTRHTETTFYPFSERLKTNFPRKSIKL